MKKKLLFVISQFYKGGAETATLNLLKCLNKDVYEIDLIVLNQQPVKNAVSLLDQIPAEVHILDVSREEQRLSVKEKLMARCVLAKDAIQQDPRSALLYVRDREYDWAFHIGEWWSPAFVATRVRAKQKAVWIHSDISESVNFNEEEYFCYDSCFDYYLFVSEHSMRSGLKAYPFLEKKAKRIYNITDTQSIKQLAEENVKEDYFESELPVVLTCANLRQEKNHRRQLEAMKLLKDRGVEFIWLNLGSTAEQDRVHKLRFQAGEYGLQDRFLIEGPRTNPYKYIKRADAVTVLSDYESWSMVITEAKVLGKPVIATKTSGALEQIEDHKTGILTEFQAEHIADCIQEFLNDGKLRDVLQNNLNNFDNTQDVLDSFDALILGVNAVQATEKDLLYVIDDINYLGGAHVATKLQIKALLSQGKDITIFSTRVPNAKVRTELMGAHFLSWTDFPENTLYSRRLLDCLLDPKLTQEEKEYKKKLTYEGKVRKNPDLFNQLVLPRLSRIFSQYNTVCVMSEGSAFRQCVAEATCKNKVQWIHTDYAEWMNLSDYTKQVTKNDGALYEKFDKIVVLTQNIKFKFGMIYPHLVDKVVISPNLMPVEDILKKAEEKKEKGNKPLHFVTVGRVDSSKGYDRLFRVLEKLYQEGYRFKWTIIGDGVDFDWISALFKNSVLKDSVKMTGAMENPFPVVKDADIFALLSNYEGLPNTIYEALILGVPVLATDVGGIATQIEDGVTGWLVESDEKKIYEKLEYLLMHHEEVALAKESIKNYTYDNQQILKNAQSILFS